MQYKDVMSKKPQSERWKLDPDESDYAAALGYLSLIAPPVTAEDIVTRLRTAEVATFKAKDLLRASRLPLLPPDDFHVAADLRKVKKGQPLTPVLVVRGQFSHAVELTVADGYHRICASYALNEDADVPCRLVDSR